MTDRPPILGRWAWLYALVILDLVLCIVLFRYFGRTFS